MNHLKKSGLVGFITEKHTKNVQTTHDWKGPQRGMVCIL